MTSKAMPSVTDQFVISYRQALSNYVSSGEEENELMLAYELGRQAVSEHRNILDLINLHQEVILLLIQEGGVDNRVTDYFKRGETFMAEVMAPFEMMHRGFIDTIHQLQEMNTTLEQRVDERTRDLQESRRKTADLSRLYMILSSINSAIVRLDERSELFKEACRIAVDREVKGLRGL